MIKTRPEVLALLSELSSVKWFGSVGLPVVVALPRWLTILRVDSWNKAGRVIRSNQTEEFLIESQNELYLERSEALKSIQSDRIRVLEFNAWIADIRVTINAVARVACHSFGIPQEVGNDYEKVLYWIIQKACVIRHFDEYIKENRLYTNIIDLILSGHCVCGWEGEYPAGSLVVY